MSGTVVIDTLEQLNKFLNEKGVMEIAIRNQSKRFKTFQKVMINNLTESKNKELAEKVIHALNKNTALNEAHLRSLGRVANLTQIGLVFNGLNLCATCAGFAIMYAKLDSISAEINKQLSQIHSTLKSTQDINNEYEFNKVLADHTDMLDCQRKQQPYSEEKLRDLVDREYNVLALLIKSFKLNVSGDHGALVFSIMSLLSMFTVSLRLFDEMYYYNNHEVLGDKDVWHMSHAKWMSVYDVLTSKWFVEKLQDYAFFETTLSSFGVDIYYHGLVDQVIDLREEIEDNQALIIAMGDIELLKQYKDISSKKVADVVSAAFREAGSDLEESVVDLACQETMQQVSLE